MRGRIGEADAAARPRRGAKRAAARVGQRAAILLTAAALAGCTAAGPAPPEEPDGRTSGPRAAPLPVQQARAYPETVTGRFVSLADFEDAPDAPPGHRQVRHFAIDPPAGDDALRFVVNITRTGVGALAVDLPPGAELVFRTPYIGSLGGYTLLSIALHSETIRDDLRVTLVSDSGRWQSHPTLVEPGWNTVLVDVRAPAEGGPGFDPRDVEEIRLAFTDAAAGMLLHVDDVMLIDNRRAIPGAPRGVAVRKAALDYEIDLPGRAEPIRFNLDADGLWRAGRDRTIVQLAAPGEALPDAGEDLRRLGPRRIGRIELLEINPVRVRLANTWYFPRRAGEWASLAVRRIAWEHTFYADGRWVTAVELNNAGGEEIGSLRLRFGESVALAGHGITDALHVDGYAGPVSRWRFGRAANDVRRTTMLANFLEPGRVRLLLGPDAREQAIGGIGRDGFDESEGCYVVTASRTGSVANCRFELLPPTDGVLDPVFRVRGGFRADDPPAVNSEGLSVRRLGVADDGSLLFVLPGRYDRPATVEVAGKADSRRSSRQ